MALLESAALELSGLPVMEAQLVAAAVALHLGAQTRRHRVHNRRAHSMQPPRGAVSALFELAAGVQLGEHHLQRRNAPRGMSVHRDAAPVVEHLHRPVSMKRDVHAVGEAGRRLVHRVVDDLPDQMHQALRPRAPDVHTGVVAHRFKVFESLDCVRVIGRTESTLTTDSTVSGGRCGRRDRHGHVGLGVQQVHAHQRPGASAWMRRPPTDGAL